MIINQPVTTYPHMHHSLGSSSNTPTGSTIADPSSSTPNASSSASLPRNQASPLIAQQQPFDHGSDNIASNITSNNRISDNTTFNRISDNTTSNRSSDNITSNNQIFDNTSNRASDNTTRTSDSMTSRVASDNGVTTITHTSPSAITTISSNNCGTTYTTITSASSESSTTPTTRIIKSQPLESSSMPPSPTLGIDQNKICQWVCCECALAHGSILYNDHKRTPSSASSAKQSPIHSQQLPRSSPPKKTASSTSLRDESDLISKVKYYSSLIYNNFGVDPLAPTQEEDENKGNDNYQYRTDRAGEACQDDDHVMKQSSSLDSTSSDSSSTSLPSPASPVMNRIPYEEDSNRDAKVKTEEIILKLPVRFTCYRCNHMMCPYCSKIRVKDLEE